MSREWWYYDYLLKLLVFLAIISGENGRVQTASRRRVHRRHHLSDCSPIVKSNSLIHNIYRTFINSLARLTRFASCIGNALSCPEKSRWFDHGNAIRNLLESDFLAIRSILIVGAKLITKRAWLVKIHRDRNFISALSRYVCTKPECCSTVWRQNDKFHKLLFREIRSS